MKASDIPVKFPIAWGADAGGSFIRAIPEASQIGIQNGAASLTDGFPPLNFLPRGAGGVPPFGEDANGILKQITQWNQWASAGGPNAFDSVFAAAIGGYPTGCLVGSIRYPGVLWLCTADDNETDPDSAAAANWAVGAKAALNAATTFHVAPTGSDTTGNGTAGTPWATLQNAYDQIVRLYNLQGNITSIQMADATYTGGLIAGAAPSGIVSSIVSFPGFKSNLIIKGNAVTPSNVTISTAADCIQAIGGARIHVQDLKVTSSGGNGLAQIGGYISFSGVNFGSCAGDHCYSDSGGSMGCTDNYTITGGAASHIFVKRGGLFLNIVGTGTITGTPAFSIAFAFADILGIIETAAFIGSATGVRYDVRHNAVIDTNGGGANFFPGSSPGTNNGGPGSNGGIYI